MHSLDLRGILWGLCSWRRCSRCLLAPKSPTPPSVMTSGTAQGSGCLKAITGKSLGQDLSLIKDVPARREHTGTCAGRQVLHSDGGPGEPRSVLGGQPGTQQGEARAHVSCPRLFPAFAETRLGGREDMACPLPESFTPRDSNIPNLGWAGIWVSSQGEVPKVLLADPA